MISDAAAKAGKDIFFPDVSARNRFYSTIKASRWEAVQSTFYVKVEAVTECGEMFGFKVGRAVGAELFSRLVTVNIYYAMAVFCAKK